EHNSVAAEDFRRVENDRCEIVGCPRSRFGGRNNSGDFTDQVFSLGDLRHVSLPLRSVPLLNFAVAAVVEDEMRIGAGVDELGRVEQLLRPHAEIEAETQLAEQANVLDERLFQT